MGSPPPPFYRKCPKESPKKITQKLLDSGWTPPPLFGQCPKGSGFFFGITSLITMVFVGYMGSPLNLLDNQKHPIQLYIRVEFSIYSVIILLAKYPFNLSNKLIAMQRKVKPT